MVKFLLTLGAYSTELNDHHTFTRYQDIEFGDDFKDTPENTQILITAAKEELTNTIMIAMANSAAITFGDYVIDSTKYTYFYVKIVRMTDV